MLHFRRRLKRSTLVQGALGLLVVFAAAACLGPIRGTVALKDAQDLFNEASIETIEQYNQIIQRQDVRDLPPPRPSEKYQKVVEIIEGRVLNNVQRDDLKVNAYALAAFSHWRLGNYPKARTMAVDGKDLYERSGLVTNRRDYGMLIICRGLVNYSIAYRDFETRKKSAAFLSPEDAGQIEKSMQAALDEIDEINTQLDKNEPVVIYANTQQLLIIRNILRAWDSVKDKEEKKPAFCKWTATADSYRKTKFPEGEFPGKARVDDLHDQITRQRRLFEPCP